jgi:hypothetical protein
MAAIQTLNGQTRLYYQKADGSLWQYALSGPFDTGIVDVGFTDTQITPADEVQKGTLITAVQLEPLDPNSNFLEVDKTNLELFTDLNT